MRNLRRIKEVTYEVAADATIKGCIIEGMNLAVINRSQLGDESDVLCSFVFDGITVSVKVDSDPELIFQSWERAAQGLTEKGVGPYPDRITN